MTIPPPPPPHLFPRYGCIFPNRSARVPPLLLLTQRPDQTARASPDNHDLHVGWEQVQRDLDARPGSHAVYHYEVVSAEGARRPLSRTVGAQAERVDGGESSSRRRNSTEGGSPPTRESCSFVYHCLQGSGRTALRLPDGTATQVDWRQGDTFAVPAWTERVHTSAAARSYLFAVNDLPLLSNLGMYRKE